jgi:diaminohydroxyphosphoribosylaminopyrimidine deaminase/5-amino-6-(5-phosphoribosylamino)uracil reductase
MQRGRPWLRLKAAVSLDGRTALPDGTSQWITGLEARTDGHRFRRRAVPS